MTLLERIEAVRGKPPMAHREVWPYETLSDAVFNDPSIVLFWLGCLLIPFALAFLASPS